MTKSNYWILSQKYSKQKNTIQLINVYNNKSRSFEDEESFKYLPSSIENLNFKSIKDYENVLNNSSWTYDFDKSDENFIFTGESYKDRKELKKSLKKKKKKIKKGTQSVLNLFWLNNLVDYKYGEKNLNKVYEQKSIDYNLSDLVPLITEPKNRRQIRPNENAYIIKFDSVGYYDKYEFEIKCTSKSIDRLILKEVLKFTKNVDKKRFLNLIYTGEQKKCEILIDVKKLAEIIYRLEKENINLDEIPDLRDPGCGLCLLEALYTKQYSMRIRGVVDGFAKEDLWHEIELFQFQCPKQ